MSAKVYRLNVPVRADYRGAAGHVELELDPGEHKPANEAELEFFDHLVTIGAAEIVSAKRAK